MDKRMDARIIKQDNLVFSRHFPYALPSMGWYFSSTRPKGSIFPESKVWSCMFQHVGAVAQGKTVSFSEGSSGCSGAACYFGFMQPSETAGSFLASKEKFKKQLTYGHEFYRQIKAEKPKDKYLTLSSLEKIEDNICIEVVNYWVTPLILSGLVTLSNFDSPKNNNVSIPFASGCQSMWTIPYKERDKNHPKATVGALDPAMRQYIANDTILFSVPAARFHEMAKNISKSFAAEDNWLNLKSKYQ